MCALFSYFHWLTMVAMLQLKAFKHFVYFVSIAVVTFTLLKVNILYITVCTASAQSRPCTTHRKQDQVRHDIYYEILTFEEVIIILIVIHIAS